MPRSARSTPGVNDTRSRISVVVSETTTLPGCLLGCAHAGTTVLNVLTVALTIATACVGAAALVVSVAAWRSSRGRDGAHVERAAFMSTVGMLSSAIFLFLILMSGLVPHAFLETCAR